MTAREYEIFVKHFLEAFSKGMEIPQREFMHQKTYTGLTRKWKIDISYSLEDLGFNHRVFIECKNWNKVVDVNTVTWIREAIHDCGAQKGIVVTTKGYTEPAIEMAKKVGIGTATINDKNELTMYSNLDSNPSDKILPYSTKNSEKIIVGAIYPFHSIYEFLEKQIGTNRANLLHNRDFMNYFSYDNDKLRAEVDALDKMITAYRILETGALPLELPVQCGANKLWYEIMMYQASQTYDG